MNEQMTVALLAAQVQLLEEVKGLLQRHLELASQPQVASLNNPSGPAPPSPEQELARRLAIDQSLHNLPKRRPLSEVAEKRRAKRAGR